VAYNLVLVALVGGSVVLTSPHFAPSFQLSTVPRILVPVFLANLCYSVAYAVDLSFQRSSWRERWLKHRWILWVAGTVVALVIAHHWIADRIHPHIMRA
jgi:hypothetical protein